MCDKMAVSAYILKIVVLSLLRIDHFSASLTDLRDLVLTILLKEEASLLWNFYRDPLRP